MKATKILSVLSKFPTSPQANYPNANNTQMTNRQFNTRVDKVYNTNKNVSNDNFAKWIEGFLLLLVALLGVLGIKNFRNYLF